MGWVGRTSYLSRSVAFALSLWRTLVFCVSTQPSEGGSERSPGMAASGPKRGCPVDGWMESESGQVCRSGTEGKEGRTHCCLMDMNTRKVRRSKKVVWRRLMLLLLSELLFASRWSRVGWCGGGEELREGRRGDARGSVDDVLRAADHTSATHTGAARRHGASNVKQGRGAAG